MEVSQNVLNSDFKMSKEKLINRKTFSPNLSILCYFISKVSGTNEI